MSENVNLGTLSANVELNRGNVPTSVAAMKAEIRSLVAEIAANVRGANTSLSSIGSGLKSVEGAIGASTKTIEAELKEMQLALEKTSARSKAAGREIEGHWRNVAAQVTAAGLGITTGIGLLAKAGADYQSVLVNVAGNTNMTNRQLAEMDATVKQLASNSPASMKELAEGYMHIANYGYQGADATRILDAAMKSAVGTGGDVASTGRLLAAVMHEFNIPASNAAGAMNELHMAAAKADMTLEELVDSAGPTLGFAANLGVSLTEVAAALAALARHGFNAAEASTQVRDMMAHIINPSHAATEELKKLQKATGIDLVRDFSSSGLAAKQLSGVLGDVELAAKKTHQNIADIMKTLIQAQRGGIGALALMGTGKDDWSARLKDLDKAFKDTTATETAFARAQETFNAQLKDLQDEAVRLGIDVEQALLPALKELTADLRGATGWFESLDDGSKRSLIQFVALTGGVMITVGGMAKLGQTIRDVKALTAGLDLTSLMGGVKSALGGIAAAEVEAGAAEAASASGLAALAAAAAPYVAIAIGIAGATAAVVAKVSDLNSKVPITTGELKKQAEEQAKTAKGLANYQKDLSALINRYEELSKKPHKTQEEVSKMHEILNNISVLAPNLISGYKSTGDAIGLIGDRARSAASDVRDLNQAIRDARFAHAVENTKPIIDRSEKRDALSMDVERAQYSLKTGLVPRMRPEGGWYRQSYTKHDPNNPYVMETTSVDPTVVEDRPVMDKATPAKLAAMAEETRNKLAEIAAIDAQQKAAFSGKPASGTPDHNKTFHGSGGSGSGSGGGSGSGSSDGGGEDDVRKKLFEQTHDKPAIERNDARNDAKDMIKNGANRAEVQQWLNNRFKEIDREAEQEAEHNRQKLKEEEDKKVKDAIEAADKLRKENAEASYELAEMKINASDAPEAEKTRDRSVLDAQKTYSKRNEETQKYAEDNKLAADDPQVIERAQAAVNELTASVRAAMQEYQDTVVTASKDAADKAIAEQDRVYAAQYEMNKLSYDDYVAYLKQRQAALEAAGQQWSETWVEITKNLNSLLETRTDVPFEDPFAAIEEQRKKLELARKQAQVDGGEDSGVDEYQNGIRGLLDQVDKMPDSPEKLNVQLELTGELQHSEKQAREAGRTFASEFVGGFSDGVAKTIGEAIKDALEGKTVKLDVKKAMQDLFAESASSAITHDLQEWMDGALYGSNRQGNPFAHIGGHRSSAAPAPAGQPSPVVSTPTEAGIVSVPSEGTPAPPPAPSVPVTSSMESAGDKLHSAADAQQSGASKSSAQLIQGALSIAMAASALQAATSGSGKSKSAGGGTLVGMGLGAAAGAMLPGLGLMGGMDLGGTLGGIFGGMFAEGGEPPAGKVSVVGERGPELIVPKGSGYTVLPFAKLPSLNLKNSSAFSGGAPRGDTHFHISVTHEGDINNMQDADNFHENSAWMIARQLQVATGGY